MYKEFMMQALFRSEKQGKRTSIALLLVLTILLTLIPGAAIAAPQESSAQSAAAHSGWFYYTVQPGDTLYGIARYYGVSAQAILDANGIYNPNHIYVGQRLLIPGAQAPAPAPAPAPGCAAYHTVQYGQGLGWIASYYGVNMYTLARANNIYDLNHIYAGMTLCIPGFAPPAPQPPPPAPGPVDPCNYIIQRGEWLSTIARRFGTTVQELMRINNIYNPNLIEVGQRIILPACGSPQPTPIPPQPTPVPPPAPGSVGYWTAFYYNNTDLSGAPTFVTQYPALNLDWHTGGPGNGINNDNFSALYTRSEYFRAGNYRFYATADDGVRVYVDNRLIIDGWRVQPATNYYADVNLNAGYHLIRVEYYEAGDVAKLIVSWGRI